MFTSSNLVSLLLTRLAGLWQIMLLLLQSLLELHTIFLPQLPPWSSNCLE
jgi:hypothetical protein